MELIYYTAEQSCKLNLLITRVSKLGSNTHFPFLGFNANYKNSDESVEFIGCYKKSYRKHASKHKTHIRGASTLR